MINPWNSGRHGRLTVLIRGHVRLWEGFGMDAMLYYLLTSEEEERGVEL